MAESLLQKRMWVKVDNYRALDAVIHNDAVSVGKLLLDGGMDFDEYLRRYPDNCNEETIRALTEHWNELQAQAQESVEPEQAQEPEIGGMNLG